jgi:hypothetical protein
MVLISSIAELRTMAPQESWRLQNCLNSLKREKALLEVEFERRKENIRAQLLLATTGERARQLLNDLGLVNDEKLREIAKINAKIHDVINELNRSHLI